MRRTQEVQIDTYNTVHKSARVARSMNVHSLSMYLNVVHQQSSRRINGSCPTIPRQHWPGRFRMSVYHPFFLCHTDSVSNSCRVTTASTGHKADNASRTIPRRLPFPSLHFALELLGTTASHPIFCLRYSALDALLPSEERVYP